MTRALRWLVGFWAAIDDETERGPFGAFEAGVLCVAALGLAVMQFGGAEITYYQLWGRALLDAGHPYYQLFGLIFWVAFCVIGYVLVPAIYLKLTGRRVLDQNLGWRGTGRHLHVYTGLFLAVLTPLVIVSYTPEYQAIYPFYKHADRSWADLLMWELGYGIQFLCLEFFFRGFMLEGLRKAMGGAAVFVMIVPYCMLHFQKTFSESAGAIVAGIILGTLAMRWRSIWGGVLIHWSVAISMDLASLIQQGDLPKVFWGPPLP